MVARGTTAHAGLVWIAAAISIAGSGDAGALSNPTEIRAAALEDRFFCPMGGTLAGEAPPYGNQIWCEVDGQKHGPAVTFAYRDHPQNFVSFTGSYRRGRLHGPYVVWGKDGAPWDVGEYRDGRRVAGASSGNGRDAREVAPRAGMPMALGLVAGVVVLLFHGAKVAAASTIPLRPLFRFQIAMLATMWPAVIGFAAWMLAVLAYARGARLDSGDVLRPLLACAIFVLIEVGRTRLPTSRSSA